MVFSVRVSLWLFAVVLAAVPVILSVASSPSQIGHIFGLVFYSGKERDVLFTCISVLAIGIVDAFDCIASNIDDASPINKAGLGFAILLSVVLIGQIIVYAAWTTTISDSQENLESLKYVSLVSIVSAFSSRILLLLGAA